VTSLQFKETKSSKLQKDRNLIEYNRKFNTKEEALFKMKKFQGIESKIDKKAMVGLSMKDQNKPN